VAPGHIQQCHYYTVDASFAFWASLAVYLMLRIPSKRWWIYLLCGAAWGMTGGTRLLGVVLGAPLAVAILRPAEAGEEGFAVRLRRLVGPPVLLCGVLAAALTVCGEPFLVLDPDHFLSRDDLKRFTMAMDVASGEIVRVWTLYDFGTTPYLFYLTSLFRHALGLPLEVAALAGVGLALWLRPKGCWVILCWLGVYFLLVGRLHTKPIRYTTPMLPALSVLGAWTCVQAGCWLRSWTGRRWLYGLPALLVTVPTGAHGLATAALYDSEDCRFQARAWANDNIPKGSVVLAERGGFSTTWMIPGKHYFQKTGPGSAFIRVEGHYPYWAQLELLRMLLSDVEWIVLTEENRMRQYLMARKQFPVGYMLYDRLSSGRLGFSHIASFHETRSLLGWEFSERGADPTVTAFDHPVVSVYRRSTADLPAVLDEWESELIADPALPDGLVRSGVQAYKQQNWERAILEFSRSVEVSPGFLLGRILVREAYLRQGNKSRAAEILEMLEESDLRPREAFVGMYKAGLRSEGLFYLDHYLGQLSPDDSDHRQTRKLAAALRFEFAVALTEQDRRDEAMKQYRRAIELVPGYPGAHANLGAILLDGGEHADAEPFLKRAAELDPSQTAVHVNLGILYYNQDDYESALSAFREAEKTAQGDVEKDVRLGLGQTYEKLGMADEAAREYSEVLRIHPGHELALERLGRLESRRSSGGDTTLPDSP